MWTAWFLLGFIQIGTGRWFARFWKKANMVHSLTGIAITLITLIEGISSVYRVGEIEARPHTLAGFVLTCGVTLVSLFGVIAFRVRDIKWNTPIIKKARTAHKIIGYLAFYSTFFTLSSGIFVFYKKFRSGS